MFLLSKFRLEKYDFDLYKGFFMKKKTQKSADFEIFFFELSDSYDKFQEVAKNIEGFCFFKKNFHI
jgi:hypothetical protein